MYSEMSGGQNYSPGIVLKNWPKCYIDAMFDCRYGGLNNVFFLVWA